MSESISKIRVYYLTSNAGHSFFYFRYHKCMNGNFRISGYSSSTASEYMVDSNLTWHKSNSLPLQESEILPYDQPFSGSLPLSFDFSSAAVSRKGKVGGVGAKEYKEKMLSPPHPTRQRQPLVAPNVFFVFDSGGGHVLERLE